MFVIFIYLNKRIKKTIIIGHRQIFFSFIKLVFIMCLFLCFAVYNLMQIGYFFRQEGSARPQHYLVASLGRKKSAQMQALAHLFFQWRPSESALGVKLKFALTSPTHGLCWPSLRLALTADPTTTSHICGKEAPVFINPWPIHSK